MEIVREIASPQGMLPYACELGDVVVEGAGPELTYAAYFAGLEAFVAQHDFGPVRQALAAAAGGDAIGSIVLRAEKHGALYHPASLTVRNAQGVWKFCVNVAATPTAMACLEEEAGLLAGLRQRFTPEFLPCPYAFGRLGDMAFLLEQWCAGFHEFHQDGAGRVRLWDYDAGERLLAGDEARTVYREAARILTRYFDRASGASIGPWHHAAGDFVARVSGGAVTVRLITVRGYSAAGDFAAAGAMAEKLAVLSFLTNMSLRLRLDRVDGVGALFLADAAVAGEAVVGFAQGLAERADFPDDGRELLDFLKSFSSQEMATAGVQLLEPCSPEETALLTAAWPAHAAALCQVLQAL